MLVGTSDNKLVKLIPNSSNVGMSKLEPPGNVLLNNNNQIKIIFSQT